MSKKRINSRQKGKAIELKAVHFLKSLGFTDARRTAQHCGKSGDAADVVCPESLPNIHFEVKGDKSIGLGTKALAEACEQAYRDARPLRRVPMVLWWENRKGWRLTENGSVRTTLDDVSDIAFFLRFRNDPSSMTNLIIEPKPVPEVKP